MKTNNLKDKHQSADSFACTKVAWIRDQNAPIGQPAKGRLNCRCGGAPETDFKREQGNVNCACGKVFTWDGWILPQVTLNPLCIR